MRAYIEVEKIQGCYIEGEHPLPIFRDMEENKPSRGDGTLAAEGADVSSRIYRRREHRTLSLS